MGRVPVFGFIYRKAIVTVDRSSPENRQQSISILKRIIKRGISVVVFPEGTFNTTGKPLKDFYDGAFRVAVETQTPVKPVLFLDAFERMNYRSIFSLTPGRCRIVYLDEIPVEGLEVPELKEKVYAVMEKTLLAYKAPWLGSLQDS
jgi:1-acyl-sn-glycerol-3-phosphate acyltransferase